MSWQLQGHYRLERLVLVIVTVIDRLISNKLMGK